MQSMRKAYMWSCLVSVVVLTCHVYCVCVSSSCLSAVGVSFLAGVALVKTPNTMPFNRTLRGSLRSAFNKSQPRMYLISQVAHTATLTRHSRSGLRPRKPQNRQPRSMKAAQNIGQGRLGHENWQVYQTRQSWSIKGTQNELTFILNNLFTASSDKCIYYNIDLVKAEPACLNPVLMTKASRLVSSMKNASQTLCIRSMRMENIVFTGMMNFGWPDGMAAAQDWHEGGAS